MKRKKTDKKGTDRKRKRNKMNGLKKKIEKRNG